jgi:hypothetical protein
MSKYEPEQTYYSSPKVGYKCHKCGTKIEVVKSNDATGNDIITVSYPEQKDATG